MELWEKIRRFLLLWLCVLVLLIVAAVVTQWSEIVMWTNGQVQAVVSTLVPIAVLLFVIGFFWRSIF